MTNFDQWTVHFVRKDGRESRVVNLRGGSTILSIAGAMFLLLGLGAAVGLYWALRVEGEGVSELRGHVVSLQGRLLQVTELASRLGEVEEQYGRLQAAVTDGRPEPEPSATVLLGQRTGLAARSDAEATSFAWPLAQKGFITRTFGSRGDASREGHTGIDIAVPDGSYVRAIKAGRVEEVGVDDVYGKFVRIAHAGGLTSLYGHNSWLFVAPGHTVERLQVIALAGNTGRSTAPHLHLELAQGGSLLDPIAYVSWGAVTGPDLDSR